MHAMEPANAQHRSPIIAQVPVLREELRRRPVMLASIFPHSFQLIISINVLGRIIVGGMGSLPGVVVGAAALIGLPELLREFGEYRFLFYGLVIVVMMRIKPAGLWPSAARRREMQIDEESEATIRAQLGDRAPVAAESGREA